WLLHRDGRFAGNLCARSAGVEHKQRIWRIVPLSSDMPGGFRGYRGFDSAPLARENDEAITESNGTVEIELSKLRSEPPKPPKPPTAEPPAEETAADADNQDAPGQLQVREAPAVDPVVISSADELRQILPWLLREPAIGLDIETTGLNPFRSSIRLVQLAGELDTYVVDIARVPVTALQPVLDDAKSLVVHNGKFDLRHLVHAGLTLPHDLGSRIRDTYLAAQLLAAGDLATQYDVGLAGVAWRYLGVSLDKTEQLSDWSGELTEAQLRYAARDAAILLPLR